jgi:hypothetical protein
MCNWVKEKKKLSETTRRKRRRRRRQRGEKVKEGEVRGREGEV